MNVLVTTLNEADTIGPLVAALKEVCERVVVVDDGRTTDNTEQVAAAFGAETFTCSDVTGIGPCLLLGLRHCQGTRVAVIDAGGSHDPYELPLMAQYSADVVIGSRYVPGAHYTGRPARKRASRWYARACNRVARAEITDWTSGFRIYSPRAVSTILESPPKQRMHAFQPAALRVCIRGGCTVAEFPIHYKAGRSSMNRKHAWEAVKTLGALR